MTVNSACIHGIPIKYSAITKDFKEGRAKVRTFASQNLSVSLETQDTQNKWI